MKKIETIHLLFLMLFIYHFASLDYGNITAWDMLTSSLATVWFIIAVISTILKIKAARYE